MRCGHAKHGRTARKRPPANPTRAGGPSPPAFSAKRRTPNRAKAQLSHGNYVTLKDPFMMAACGSQMNL
jgi:hypothetical protein